jgi:hypothetical protein
VKKTKMRGKEKKRREGLVFGRCEHMGSRIYWLVGVSDGWNGLVLFFLSFFFFLVRFL